MMPVTKFLAREKPARMKRKLKIKKPAESTKRIVLADFIFPPECNRDIG
jgi:RNA-binding protein YlmH